MHFFILRERIHALNGNKIHAKADAYAGIRETAKEELAKFFGTNQNSQLAYRFA